MPNYITVKLYKNRLVKYNPNKIRRIADILIMIRNIFSQIASLWRSFFLDFLVLSLDILRFDQSLGQPD